MIIYENTLSQFKKDIRRKKLVNFICAEYESAVKAAVSGEARYAWKYTFNILYELLERMKNDANPESGVRIDLEEGAPARHMKLLFASGSNDGFRYSLLGIYAGSIIRLTKAEDIVSFREGSLQWSAVHPSMFISSFAKRLLGGIPQSETGSITYECASWLFDSFYSGDSDILTDYNRHLTSEYPVFYANDQEELIHFLQPVLRSPGGLDALRKLHTVEASSAAEDTSERNEGHIYLISSITNNVLRGRKAWYILEKHSDDEMEKVVRSAAGRLAKAGKSVLYVEEDEMPEGQPDLLVVHQKSSGIPDLLEYADVCIFLYDRPRDPNFESFLEDALLTSLARDNGAQLYISHLKQALSFADGGKGMRWLVNRLQMAEIPREDYNPDVYQIKLVNSRDDFPKGDSGMANVVIPPNASFDPKTGKITMKKAQMKGIYNALSGGRNGVLIFCTDQLLRSYLEKEITALKNRQAWIRNYTGSLSGGKALPDEGMDTIPGDTAEAIKAADDGYSKKIRTALGKGAWRKLSEESRTWLISALMIYDHLKDIDRAMDFSGVCVQIGKACEYELKRRIFTDYVNYEKSLYGEENLPDKLPSECFSKGDDRKPPRLLSEDKVSLGKLRYIMGLDDGGKVVNVSAWTEFRSYAEKNLLVNPSNSARILQSQLPVITRIKDDYRNRSAHAKTISIVDAGECIEYVITVNRKLGVLLDQYLY